MHWRDMNTGTKISAAGHGALILWVLLGGVLFRAREPAFEFANVSVISEAEFASLREAAAPREQPSESQAAGTPPPPRPAPPEPAPEPEPPPPQPAAEPPPPEPEPPPPEPAPEPEPSPDPGSTVLQNEADRPAPQQADIVAEEETPPPVEDVQEAPVPQEAVQPEPAEEPQVVTEETAPAAPEETTTAIVTEADTPAAGGGALAPERSLRPRLRPERVAAAEPAPEPPPAPQPAPQPAAEPEPQRPPEPAPAPQPEQSVEDAIAAAAADAVAEALAAAQGGPTSETGGSGRAASGPPLTGGERDAFRLAVQRCWVIDPGSEASRISVTVAFSLDPSGRVSAGPTMIANSGGADAAVRTAFEAARRAIVRCGASGFPLPPEKYEQWREVEMTFDASGGRIR